MGVESMKIRQDAWSEEDDLLLAETVLRHVREGSTQLNAFEEVGDRLNRTSAACGFRWNAVVRHNYEKALQLAKKQRKQRQRALGQNQQPAKKKLLYTPPEPSLVVEIEASEPAMSLIEEASSEFMPVQENTQSPAVFTPAQPMPAYNQGTIGLEQVIAFLQSLKGKNLTADVLQRENERLKQENYEIAAKNEELAKKIAKLEQSSMAIQEDYETLMKIMNRARKMVVLEEDERPATKFKMDRNGNLEKVAE